MIFNTLVRLPWWVFATASAVFFALAMAGGDWAKERGGAIRMVMERPSAPVVPFAELEVRDRGYAEAAFAAQVVADAAQPATADMALQDAGVLLPLAAPDATEAPDRPAAVAVVLQAGASEWRDLVAPFATGEGALGPILSIEGEIRTEPPEWRRGEFIDDGGFRNVVWVVPYRDGRQATLERNLGLLGWGALPFWGTGIFFAVLAGARFFATRGS